MPAVKLEEVAKYHMEGPANQPAFTMNPLVMLMNKQKYDNLSPELKAVVDKNSGMALVELAGNAWDGIGVNDCVAAALPRARAILESL